MKHGTTSRFDDDDDAPGRDESLLHGSPLVLWSNQVSGCSVPGSSGWTWVKCPAALHSTSAISTSPFAAADFLFLLLFAGASWVFLAGAAGAAGAWTEETGGVQVKPFGRCSGEATQQESSSRSPADLLLPSISSFLLCCNCFSSFLFFFPDSVMLALGLDLEPHHR